MFRKERCCQCGACLASCQDNALAATVDQDGLATIRVAPEKCTRCGACVRVCPAHQLPSLRLEDTIWPTMKEAGLAWHADTRIRQAASSGGAARALLAGCLSEGQCEAVYTLMRQKESPWAAGALIRGHLDAGQVASSMYLPITALEHLRFTGTIKSMAIVGTTCQLLAATKLLKGRVETLLRIAILCKQQKHLGFTRFAGKRLGLAEPGKPDRVDYRGHGWPGRVTVDNRSLEWEQAAAIPFGKRLWRVPGCLFCPNPLGYKADITLADPWGLEPCDTAGKTMAIAWTATGSTLLHATPHLHFEPRLAPADIKRSIDWRNLQRKARLIRFYQGRNVPGRVALGGHLERIQTTVLERCLNKWRLPGVLYKVIAHLPDPLHLIPVSGERE